MRETRKERFLRQWDNTVEVIQFWFWLAVILALCLFPIWIIILIKYL